MSQTVRFLVLEAVRDFNLPALWLTQPPIQYVQGVFLQVIRPGREVHHLPPSSADINTLRTGDADLLF